MDGKITIMEWNEIQGYCNFHALYALVVRHFPDDSHFVEVGCWFGHSSAFMATCIKESQKRIKFDCIDIWELGEWSDEPHFALVEKAGGNLYKTFLNNIAMCALSDYINPIKKFSLEAVTDYEDRSLEFVFIDACHTYHEVTKDLEAWYPKVKLGGILAGDDYNWKEVKKAVDDFFKDKDHDLQVKGNSWIWGKTKEF